MYPSLIFSEKSLDVALEVGSLTKFSTIVTLAGDTILPIHVPLTLLPREDWEDRDKPEFVGHAMRNNPLYELLREGNQPATVIFQPADGYISPGVYAEKKISGKVVPTWNYVATHLHGMLRLEVGEGALKRILETQIADYEGAVGGDWTFDDAPRHYTDRMIKAIAGFSFTASDWLTNRKLSQNKEAERQTVTEWLDATAPPAASIAYWMRKV